MPRLKWNILIPGEKRIAINGVTVYYYNEHQIFDLRDIDKALMQYSSQEITNANFLYMGTKEQHPKPHNSEEHQTVETGQTAYKSIMN